MKEDTILVQCRFDLTDSEVAAAARKRAVLEGKMADLDAAFAVQKEKHKNVVGLLEKDAGELGMLIRRGFELRDAECRIEFDYEGGLVNTVRVDTGEIVKTRPMTDNEKSKGLPLPLGPAIALDESDPDAQDARECSSCGHLAKYHERSGCIQPDCGCNVFALVGPGETAATLGEDLTDCAHCGHPEGVHANTRKRGCMRADCNCKGYVHPDPLGIADVEPEKREAEL